MSVRWATVVVIVAAALCGAGGCAGADHRPKYAAPQLAAGELATVGGVQTLFAHYYIGEVDGARVQDEGAMFFNPAAVKVLPGERRIGIFATTGGGRQSWTITHTFLPGHQYLVGPSDKLGGMMGGGLVVKDKQTGEVKQVQ
jgi:hypothetical protein